MADSTTPPIVLGISIDSAMVHGVALRGDDVSASVVGRFVRQRKRPEESISPETLALALPGLKGAEESDYTIEMGGGGSESSAFLPSEFGISGGSGGDGAGRGTAAVRGPLQEILGEVRALGHEISHLAFAIGHPDASTMVLELSPDGPKKKGKGKGKGKGVWDEAALLGYLSDLQPTRPDPKRTAFVPMERKGDRDRVLAVTALPGEPVQPTLREMKGEGSTLLAPSSLSAETLVLVDHVAKGPKRADDEVSAVVRVGTTDTLLLVFQGNHLTEVERLRSLTAYDLPDTVASRVLLQFDQKKISDIRTLYLSVAGRHGPLLERFQDMFPNASVEPSTHLLLDRGVRIPDDEEAADEFKAGSVLAAAAALQVLRDEITGHDLLGDVEVKRKKVAFNSLLPVILAGLLVALVLVIGVARYLDMRGEIKAAERDLMLNPPEMPSQDPDKLQARVDSLSNAYITYTRALDVLDSLLIGSDQWTQALRLTTRTVDATGGTWIQNWAPDPPNVRITGQSLSRPQIVELSRRLQGTVEMLEYTDVGTRRVYTFDMLMPVETQMPPVSEFLREIAAQGPAGRDSLYARAARDQDAFILDPVGHED